MLKYLLNVIQLFIVLNVTYGQITVPQIEFVRQGVKRVVFDDNQHLPLASLDPNSIIGMAAMHPVEHRSRETVQVVSENGRLRAASSNHGEAAIWLAGFNPFASYLLDLDSLQGETSIGLEFKSKLGTAGLRVSIVGDQGKLRDVRYTILGSSQTSEGSIKTAGLGDDVPITGRLIVQLLGSGLVVYSQQEGLPKVIGQLDFNQMIDLREIAKIRSFQTWIYLKLNAGAVSLENASVALTTGTGLADIRAMTYEDGTPILDQGRLWYTMTMRGRALPHHLQGVFSMDPTLFDVRFEGAIVFDRDDGLLRNEVASHIFFDRVDSVWRGITTGFSAYANIQEEEKQLLAVESKKDPRFGFSVMKARPMGQIGDIEDPHILFDAQANKWRILTCENIDGYKAVMLESDQWDRGYTRIAGPVTHNSTGTSMQRIDGQLYCFSGSEAREVFVYTYPDLRELGVLDMDLPPWDESANTRVWPNVVELPEGYPFRYVALMMDRYNYPGIQGDHWTYGALYLYHGFFPVAK
ncbi:MAG: hypothetical protein ACTHZ7_09515 [Sphingobacterium sp.]